MCINVLLCCLQAKAQATLVFNRLFPHIKEEPGHPAMVHPRYFCFPIFIYFSPQWRLIFQESWGLASYSLPPGKTWPLRIHSK